MTRLILVLAALILVAACNDIERAAGGAAAGAIVGGPIGAAVGGAAGAACDDVGVCR